MKTGRVCIPENLWELLQVIKNNWASTAVLKIRNGKICEAELNIAFCPVLVLTLTLYSHLLFLVKLSYHIFPHSISSGISYSSICFGVGTHVFSGLSISQKGRQSFAVTGPPVNMNFPSGENATVVTPIECTSKDCFSIPVKFQSVTVLPHPPVSIHFPSGENTTDNT